MMTLLNRETTSRRTRGSSWHTCIRVLLGCSRRGEGDREISK